MKTFQPNPTEVVDKQKFYRQQRIAAGYDRQRFGSPSGAWVNEREIAAVERLLPATGRILDLGCGTGRLSQRLIGNGRDIILLDASDAMLAQAVPLVGAPAVLADAFNLPFAANSFDAVVALRVSFHFADLDGLIQAVAPILRPGGSFVFDTYRWTPRALVAVGQKRWGGKVHLHSDAAVQRAATTAGLSLADSDACFLFSPYIYRLLPLSAVQLLGRLETQLPASVRARAFWKLRKSGP